MAIAPEAAIIPAAVRVREWVRAEPVFHVPAATTVAIVRRRTETRTIMDPIPARDATTAIGAPITIQVVHRAEAVAHMVVDRVAVVDRAAEADRVADAIKQDNS